MMEKTLTEKIEIDLQDKKFKVRGRLKCECGKTGLVKIEKERGGN